jgi:hypothetical protein
MKTVQMMVLACVTMVAAVGVYQCTPATQQKVATGAIDLIACIDKNQDQTIEQIAITCGIAATPDLISLLAERKQVFAAKKTCPSWTDAGSIPGK